MIVNLQKRLYIITYLVRDPVHCIREITYKWLDIKPKRSENVQTYLWLHKQLFKKPHELLSTLRLR